MTSGRTPDSDGGGWPKPTDGPQGRADQPPSGRSRSTAAAFWAVLVVAVVLGFGYAIFTWVLSQPTNDAAATSLSPVTRIGRAA